MQFLYKGQALPHGHFPLHSQFESVLNFLAEGKLVSLVSEKVGGGPRRIVVSNLTKLHDYHHLVLSVDVLASELRISAQNQVLHSCSLEQLPSKHFTLPCLDLSLVRERLSNFENYFVKVAPKKSLFYLLDKSRTEDMTTSFERVLMESFKEAYSPLGKSSFLDVLQAFKGKGMGLTPSGDDFNLGLLTALSLQGAVYPEYFSLARGESIFVNSFLSELEEKQVSEKTYLWLRSFEESEESFKEATLKLLSQGETSGADWLVGFISGFDIQTNSGRLYAT